MTEAEWLEDSLYIVPRVQESLGHRRVKLLACACCRIMLDVLGPCKDLAEGALRAAEREADGAPDFRVLAYYTSVMREAESKPFQRSDLEPIQRHAVSDVLHGIRYLVARPGDYSSPPSGQQWAVHKAISNYWLCYGGSQEESGRHFYPYYLDIAGNPFRPVPFSPSWLTSTTLALAARMYESRDFGAMPILADALQDAGCDSADVLDHCRGPGPHVRGCWVVDLVLGKE
ncbi:hypothetical protein [Gemmata palustris]|uniref:hypothetical protein n=1 Tax=Gemmata palustris TaxID=2822762 RepID=UPI001FEAE2C9|nr:hypothetical protein [Gemmata palustris]